MNTTFIINGGAGRVINSMPALEKYQRLNPDDDFIVLVDTWESFFWCHPTLQSRTFPLNQKGNFERYMKDHRVICPEPYHNNDFINQKINLTEAFDQEINQSKDHSDLNYSCLHLSSYEISKSFEFIEDLKNQKKKRKVVVFQPFGSSTSIVGNKVIDSSNRSFESKDYLKIVQSISTDCVVLYASMPEFLSPQDRLSVTFDHLQPYHRTLMCMVYHCDYFVGCCSVGQHVARAFKRPGLICMGGTSEKNFSYPDHFSIYRKPDKMLTYVPWRLSIVDCEFADRSNDGLMKFDEKELDEIITLIREKIGSSTKEGSDNIDALYS